MKVKIPKTIKIGTLLYGVVFTPHLVADDKLFGRTDTRRQEIQIDNDIPFSCMNITLLHEILHIIQDVYRVDMTDENTDRVASGIAELLFNNLGIEFDWSDV